MSLRRAYTLTPARLAANRRNAQKCTGPRTGQGKAQSRINALRDGGRSALYHNLMLTLLHAPPCAVDQTARAVLTPELAAHPVFAELVNMFRQAEREVALQTRLLHAPQSDPARAERERTERASRKTIQSRPRATIDGEFAKKRC
jgi:hypothetical protein